MAPSDGRRGKEKAESERIAASVVANKDLTSGFLRDFDFVFLT
jgi:hypothetical protein